MIEIYYTEEFFDDVKYLQKTGNEVIIAKLERFRQEIAIDPYTGTGHPKAMKYGFSGCWSRELSKKDRLVYRVEEQEQDGEKKIIVTILKGRGHYGDK
ncbi:MAG: Txe/YoeB family addiction module toxin [Bacteroidales bacterium]|jgi:toxin YoeB|nr:Txe/YoeB family addiction module toxin [Bacteroidales bacterium]